jgi:hypothetical protein
MAAMGAHVAVLDRDVDEAGPSTWTVRLTTQGRFGLPGRCH